MATPHSESTSGDLQTPSRFFDIALLIDPEKQWESPQTLDMRLNTKIPGVIVTVGETGSPHVQTMVSYNFEGLHLQDPREDGKKKIQEISASWLPQQFEAYKYEDEYMERMGTEIYLSSSSNEAVRNKKYQICKKVRIQEDDTCYHVHEAQGDDRGIHATSSATRRESARRVKQFSIFIGPERTVDPALALRARAVILGNNAPNYLMGNSSPKPCRSSKAPHAIKTQRTIKSRQVQKCEIPESPAPITEAVISHIPVSKFCILNHETGADSMPEKEGLNDDPDPSELTWKEGEITGHDPSDPDDDGEGINGIGFRPTPHEAYLRSQKRKRQLAEYRTREAVEARRLRSERRNLATAVRDKIKAGTMRVRKVRFMGL